jgi:oxygen-independent coproporphyrinogen-3 oxidase
MKETDDDRSARTSAHVDEAQLLRFGGAGPRYTSYPTVPEWTPAFGAAEAGDALARAATRPGEALSIYVHLPFCAELCLYCGCTVQITRRADIVERYLTALEREIDAVAARLGERRKVAQMHWGGGTPTHLAPEQIERVHGMVTRRFELLPDAEQSIEVHPHVTTHAQVDVLAALGFDRISMGVQDLDERVQAVVHRYQTTAETRDLISHCRAVGINGINVDLMYGLPEQTVATFEQTLDTIASIRPDRLAVYGYAHVPWLKPFQRALEEYALPGPVERAHLFALAIDRLCSSGYEVIGLDHFALRSDALYRALEAGTLHRNFMGYTTHPAEETVALGMSAISDVGGAFYQNEHTTKEYEARIDRGELPIMRGLARSAEDDLRRAVIQDVMCRMLLDLDELERRFGRTDLRAHFATEWRDLAPLAAEGFCELGDGTLRVLPGGRLYLRHLAMVFDEYLRKKQQPSGPRFSQTV